MGTALIRVSCFLSSSPPRLGCGHWLAPLSPCPQEARGLSAVAGRGGHGPDARARLEVCVHIHSGILSLPGPEGAGKNQKVVAHFHPPGSDGENLPLRIPAHAPPLLLGQGAREQPPWLGKRLGDAGG